MDHTHPTAPTTAYWNSPVAVGVPLLTCRGVASLLRGCPGVAVATDLPAGSALCTVHRHLGSYLQHHGDHMEERRGLWDNIQQSCDIPSPTPLSCDTPSPTPLSCDTLSGHVAWPAALLSCDTPSCYVTYSAPPLRHVTLPVPPTYPHLTAT